MYKRGVLINVSGAVILLVSCFSSIEAFEFPQACDSSETTWSSGQNMDSVSAQGREEIVKLRCVLGCQFVVRMYTSLVRIIGSHAAFAWPLIVCVFVYVCL